MPTHPFTHLVAVVVTFLSSNAPSSPHPYSHRHTLNKSGPKGADDLLESMTRDLYALSDSQALGLQHL